MNDALKMMLIEKHFKADFKRSLLSLIMMLRVLNIVQPEVKSDLEARIEALEKEVYKISKSEKRR